MKNETKFANLIWRTNKKQVSFIDAKKWVKSLGKEWRLPSILELEKLYNINLKCNIEKDFRSNKYIMVWSSDKAPKRYAWGITYDNGKKAFFPEEFYHPVNRVFAVKEVKNDNK